MVWFTSRNDRVPSHDEVSQRREVPFEVLNGVLCSTPNTKRIHLLCKITTRDLCEPRKTSKRKLSYNFWKESWHIYFSGLKQSPSVFLQQYSSFLLRRTGRAGWWGGREGWEHQDPKRTGTPEGPAGWVSGSAVGRVGQEKLSCEEAKHPVLLYTASLSFLTKQDLIIITRRTEKETLVTCSTMFCCRRFLYCSRPKHKPFRNTYL